MSDDTLPFELGVIRQRLRTALSGAAIRYYEDSPYDAYNYLKGATGLTVAHIDGLLDAYRGDDEAETAEARSDDEWHKLNQR